VLSADAKLLESKKLDATESVKGGKGEKKYSKILNLIIKADTRGSLDAILSTLSAIKKEGIFINVLQEGAGAVSESDILLAASSKAIVLAFNTFVPKAVLDMAKESKVIVREYKIIYRLFEEVEGALEGILELEEEKIKGRGGIIAKFKLPKSGDIVAGCKVLAGRLRAKDKVRI